MFQPPVSREVVAQDFVDEWNRVHRPGERLADVLHSRPVEGCEDSGYDRYQGRPDRRQGLDDYTLEVTLRYPFAEFPADARPPGRRGRPGRLRQQGRPQGVQPQARRQRPVHGRGAGQNGQSVDLVKNPDYWDKDKRRLRGHASTCRSSRDDRRRGWSSRRARSTSPSIPAGQVAAAENIPQVTSRRVDRQEVPGQHGTYFVGINMSNTSGIRPATRASSSVRRSPLAADAEKPSTTWSTRVSTLPATASCRRRHAGLRARRGPLPLDPAQAKEISTKDIGTIPTFHYWFNTERPATRRSPRSCRPAGSRLGITSSSRASSGARSSTKLAKGDKGSGAQIFRMGWIADYPSMDNFV